MAQRKGKQLLALTIIAALVALTVVSSTAYAQDDGRESVKLSLNEALKLALERNFDIQLTALNSESAYSNLLSSTGIYDYQLQERFNYTNLSQRQTNEFAASQRDGQQLTSTFGRQFFTGGSASVSLSMGRSASDAISTSLNPQFGNDLTFNISQPILKNYGRLATERGIIVSRNDLKVSEIDFENQVIATLVNVQKRYWDLVSTYRALEVAREDLRLSRQNLEVNRVKVRVGTLPEIEIVQAEQRVANSESALLDTEISVQRAEDNLKTAIVMDDWDVRLDPTDDLLEPDKTEFDYTDALVVAMDNRPEVRRLDIQIESNETNIEYAKNQLKPELNISASLTMSGQGGTFQEGPFSPENPPEGLPLGFTESFTDTFSGENYDYSIGATFVYTFGNQAAKATLLRNEVSKKQNVLRKDQLRYNIAVEVRDAIRELEAAAKQLEARRKSLEYSERQYEAEKQKFDVGTSTNFEVLTFQTQLAQARLNVITAQIRYTKALIDYNAAVGKVLDGNNVEINTGQDGITGAEIKE